MFKKISVVLCSSALLLTSLVGPVAPKASATANDAIYQRGKVSLNMNSLLIPKTEFSDAGYKLYLESQEYKEGGVTTLGLRKDAVVFALRYGGDLLGKVVGILSDKNGKLLVKHADKLADALDRFEKSIEANLVNFMIMELGLSSASARSIAWAICQFAL